MGRLNKKLAKKVPTKPSGLSSAASKTLGSLKNVIEMPTKLSETTETPTANFISFSKLVESKAKSPISNVNDKVDSRSRSRLEPKVKAEKTVRTDGKIVKLSKKEKMKIRRGLLVNKLVQSAELKRAAKEKQEREKHVIVKDTKPLLDNLEEIAGEIEKDELQKKDKLKASKKKPMKHTLKTKKSKEQFMKDIEFLKAATQDSSYIADPIKTVSTHLKNSLNQ